MLREVPEQEYLEIAKPALEALCGCDNPDPFGNAFSSNVEMRRILFQYMHIPNPVRNPKLLDALYELSDEDGFYWTMRSNKKLPEKERILPYHWYVPFIVFDEFLSQGNWWFDNVIYSPNSIWGIVASDEHHGVIGGPQEFIELLGERTTNFDEQVFGFLDYWKYYRDKWKSNIDWLPNFLATIYDKERANRLLLENGFNNLVKK